MNTALAADHGPNGQDRGAGKTFRGVHPREEALYNRIIHAVIAKQLRPGERLNENQLAQSTGLSRTRIRRVLERLAAEEVVCFELNRGAFICRPTVAEARDVYYARRFVEEAVVRLLCARPAPRIPPDLRRFVSEERLAYDRHEPAVNRLSGDLHVKLAELAGNRVLLEMMSNLVMRCCIIQSLYEGRRNYLCLTHEHEDILDLIERGDADAAVAAMASHLGHIVDSLDLRPERERLFELG